MNGPDEDGRIGRRGEESSRRVARVVERRERITQRLDELREQYDDLVADGRPGERSPDQRQATLDTAWHEASAAQEEAARAHELSADAHDLAGQARRRAGREPGSPTHAERAVDDREQAHRARARDREESWWTTDEG